MTSAQNMYHITVHYSWVPLHNSTLFGLLCLLLFWQQKCALLAT